MITKNSKDIITVLKWLQVNACTKRDRRENLEKIKISRDEATVTLETTNGFSHTRAVISGIDLHPIDLPLSGMYSMTLLSHLTVEWEVFTAGNFPDVAFLYPQSPKFLVTDPFTNFSVVCGVDPSRLTNFLPAFVPSIRLCLNGAMLGMFGNCEIDDDKHPIEVTGLLMPIPFESGDHIFGENSKAYRQNDIGGWLEILQPIPEPQPVPEQEPEMEVIAQ